MIISAQLFNMILFEPAFPLDYKKQAMAEKRADGRVLAY